MANLLPVWTLLEHVLKEAHLCSHYHVSSCHHYSSSWAEQPGTATHQLPRDCSGAEVDLVTGTGACTGMATKHVAMMPASSLFDAVAQSVTVDEIGGAQMAMSPSVSAQCYVFADA